MKMLSIGIIGGMGPQASALLHQLLVQAASQDLQATQCHEFPHITHVSLPVRDFISRPERRHQSIDLLRSATQLIQSNTPDVAIVACNTAHVLVDELPELAALPLVSLPEAVIAEAKARGVKTLGLIASPTTLRMKLFDRHAEEAGIRILPIRTAERPTAERAIRAIIAGTDPALVRPSIEALVSNLLHRKAEAVALGCTELSVAMHGSDNPKTIDSLSAAAKQAMVRLQRVKRQSHARQN
jgi:aspartate racemase